MKYHARPCSKSLRGARSSERGTRPLRCACVHGLPDDFVRPLKRVSDSHALLIRSGRWIAKVIEQPRCLSLLPLAINACSLFIVSSSGRTNEREVCLPPLVLRHICKGRPRKSDPAFGWHRSRIEKLHSPDHGCGKFRSLLALEKSCLSAR